MSQERHTVLRGPPCDNNQGPCAYKSRSQEKWCPGWIGKKNGEKRKDTWKKKKKNLG